MKRNCDMVRDLMPLCIDGAASEESQQVVALNARAASRSIRICRGVCLPGRIMVRKLSSANK